MAKQHNKLSTRQQKILAFIALFVDEHGYPPSVREIGAGIGTDSTSVINYNLNKLVRFGSLERTKNVARGLRLVRDEG